jgi:hypothetical protein
MAPVCSARACSTAIILYYINKLLKRNNSSKNLTCQTNKKFQLILNCPLPYCVHRSSLYWNIFRNYSSHDSWPERRGVGIPWPSKLQGFPIFEESRFRDSFSTSGFTHIVGNSINCPLPTTDGPLNPHIVRSNQRLFALSIDYPLNPLIYPI